MNSLVKILLVSCLFIGTVMAESLKTLAMATEVGEIVLTSEVCTYDVPQQFNYRAYATDSAIEGSHEGCWSKNEKTVYIYFMELSGAIATYHEVLFAPQPNL